MLRRGWLLQRSRHQEEITGRIAQELRRDVAGKGLVVRCAGRRSCNQKIICEILHRSDDGASSAFSCDPPNRSALAECRNKPLFLFDVGGSCMHDLQIRAAMDCKIFRLCKHSGKRRRKCGSDTHMLVIHHSTMSVAFPPAPMFAHKCELGTAARIQAKRRNLTCSVALDYPIRTRLLDDHHSCKRQTIWSHQWTSISHFRHRTHGYVACSRGRQLVWMKALRPSPYSEGLGCRLSFSKLIVVVHLHCGLPVRLHVCSPPRLAATQLAPDSAANRLIAPAGLPRVLAPASRVHQRPVSDAYGTGLRCGMRSRTARRTYRRPRRRGRPDCRRFCSAFLQDSLMATRFIAW